MKRYFWLNVSLVFTLLFSLVSPVAMFAAGEETQSQTASGVFLTKAFQTDNGVSLVWETVGNDVETTSSDQSFSFVKNGESKVIIPVSVGNQSSESKKVYTYLDLGEEVLSDLEYRIVWHVDGTFFTSNLQKLAAKETEGVTEEPVNEGESTPAEEDETTTDEETATAASEEETDTSATGEETEENESISEPANIQNLQANAEMDTLNFLAIEKIYANEASFTVAWYGFIENNKEKISKYELYLDGKFVSSGGQRFSEYNFTNLKADTTYVVTVKALNSSDKLLLEESLEVKTIPTPSGGKVNFADANLAKAIKDQLHISRDIYASDMESLTELYAVEYEIKSLQGLEKAINLTTLYLTENNISDIAPLSGLTNLVDLHLEGNKIKDVSPLSNLTNLYMLGLSWNPLSNIGALASLTNLEYLFLDTTNITSLEALKELGYLTYITLMDTDLDLSEGSAAWVVLDMWQKAGVYVDILDDYSSSPLEVWVNGTSEQSISLSWWYYFYEEEAYEKDYTFHVYVDGKLYKKTSETELMITGLKAEKDYHFTVEMYDENGKFVDEAITIGTTLALPTGAVVKMKDANLADAIREQLYLPSRDIYQSDMERLDYLFAGWSNIKNLAGLEYAIYLGGADLPGNQISDLTPLKDLQYLSFLNVANNNVTTIGALKGMDIYMIDLSGNPIKDISILETMVELESVFLHITPITDISVLLTLKYLHEVTLFGMDELTFEEGSPELAVVEELLARGVLVYLTSEDYYGGAPITINVLNVTHDSIEIDWTLEGDGDVASYELMVNYEWVDTVTDNSYIFTDLEADTSYEIAVVALDEDEYLLGYHVITVSTLPYEEKEDNESPPAKDDDDKKDATPVVKPVDKDKNNNTKKTTDNKTGSKGSKLPVTATNSMNYMLIGLALLMAGIVGMIIARRRVAL